MLINNIDIPIGLIERYCAVILKLEEVFSASLEVARKKLHDKIFEVADCERSLYRRKDREFSLALNRIVGELTE